MKRCYISSASILFYCCFLNLVISFIFSFWVASSRNLSFLAFRCLILGTLAGSFRFCLKTTLPEIVAPRVSTVTKTVCIYLSSSYRNVPWSADSPGSGRSLTRAVSLRTYRSVFHIFSLIWSWSRYKATGSGRDLLALITSFITKKYRLFSGFGRTQLWSISSLHSEVMVSPLDTSSWNPWCC